MKKTIVLSALFAAGVSFGAFAEHHMGGHEGEGMGMEDSMMMEEACSAEDMENENCAADMMMNNEMMDHSGMEPAMGTEEEMENMEGMMEDSQEEMNHSH